MATLPWRIWRTPWTVEPGRLRSIGSHRVRRDRSMHYEVRYWSEAMKRFAIKGRVLSFMASQVAQR